MGAPLLARQAAARPRRVPGGARAGRCGQRGPAAVAAAAAAPVALDSATTHPVGVDICGTGGEPPTIPPRSPRRGDGIAGGQRIRD